MEPAKRKDHPINLETVVASDQKKPKVEMTIQSESEGSPLSLERITLTQSELKHIISGVVLDLIGDKQIALVNASKSGNLELVKLLVLNHKVTIDRQIPQKHRDPLWTAAKMGLLDVVKFLLEQNAYLELREFKTSFLSLLFEGQSPISAAMSSGHEEILDLLLEHSLIKKEEKLSKRLLLDCARGNFESLISKYDDYLNQEENFDLKDDIDEVNDQWKESKKRLPTSFD